MTGYAWYPVRCCCQPTKLLGFLRLPEDNKQRVMGADGRSYPVELKTMRKPRFRSFDFMAMPPGSHVADIGFSHDEELAVYSEDRGVEFWRGIPDFVEATQADR